MCLKLDNGAEYFSTQDMQRLRKDASGRMGSKGWVGARQQTPPEPAAAASGCGVGCSCNGKCVRCACAERRAAAEVEHGQG
jgi:hypothetical protein